MVEDEAHGSLLFQLLHSSFMRHFEGRWQVGRYHICVAMCIMMRSNMICANTFYLDKRLLILQQWGPAAAAAAGRWLHGGAPTDRHPCAQSAQGLLRLHSAHFCTAGRSHPGGLGNRAAAALSLQARV